MGALVVGGGSRRRWCDSRGLRGPARSLLPQMSCVGLLPLESDARGVRADYDHAGLTAMADAVSS